MSATIGMTINDDKAKYVDNTILTLQEEIDCTEEHPVNTLLVQRLH